MGDEAKNRSVLRRKWFAIVFGLISSVVFVWLAARNVDLSKVGDVLSQVQWWWLAAYVAAAASLQLLRIGRWTLLLYSLGETRIRRSAKIGAVGISAIFFLPARLGEFVRPVLISDPERVGFGEAMATVVIERLVDGIMVGIMLLLLGSFVAPSPDTASAIQATGLGVGGVFVGLTVALFLAARFSELSFSFIDKVFGRWPKLAEKLKNTIERFREGLFALVRSRHAISYLGITIVLWIASGLSLIPVFEAFALDLPIAAGFVILGATAVGILVPAGPTAVGPFHYAATLAASWFLLPPDTALSFAVLFHVGQVIANLAVGLGGIAAGGLSAGVSQNPLTADDPRLTTE